MTKNQIKHYVENNPSLVSLKNTSDPNLFVLKYKKKVFYNGLWNRYLEECRGTVIDSEFNVIQRPFTKIYNFRIENNSPDLSDDTIVNCYRKINGFMVAVSWYNNDLLVSTTGTIDSEFVSMAKEMMDIERFKRVCKLYPSFTFMFECVHKNDPHIIPEVPGLYLLGWREKTWNSKVYVCPLRIMSLSSEFGCVSPEYETMTVGELMMKVKSVRHEGYVAYTDDGVSIKVKSPYYLTLKVFARKKDILSLDKTRIDEEYFPLVDHLLQLENFSDLDEQARLEYITKLKFLL